MDFDPRDYDPRDDERDRFEHGRGSRDTYDAHDDDWRSRGHR
jgi:hypothetical protein